VRILETPMTTPADDRPKMQADQFISSAWAGCGLAWIALLLLMACSKSMAATTPMASPVHHVVVIVLENEPYEVAFGEHSLAPYLAHQLPKLGALLSRYYSIGHDSLDNYMAMISGQAPNAATQSDCKIYDEFKQTVPGLDGNGQALGKGCVYPAKVKTLANQLTAKGLDWKGYIEDMGADSAREPATFGHTAIGSGDPTKEARVKV
jgi:hypothetical protein